jgi:hypothetical protein
MYLPLITLTIKENVYNIRSGEEIIPKR